MSYPTVHTYVVVSLKRFTYEQWRHLGVCPSARALPIFSKFTIEKFQNVHFFQILSNMGTTKIFREMTPLLMTQVHSIV